MNPFTKRVVGVLILTATLWSGTAEFDTLVTLQPREELESQLLIQNPILQASKQKVEGSIAAEKMGTSIPSPVVNFVYFGESIETRTGPQEWTLGITQKIPWPGKISQSRDVARLQSGAVQAHYETSQRDVLQRFRLLWGDLYYLGRTIEVTEEIQKLTDQWLERNRSAYETGKVSFSAIIKMENRLALLTDELRSYENYTVQLQAQLDELFGVPTELQFPKQLARLRYDSSEAALSQHSLLQQIAQQQSTQAKVTQAEKSRFAPDLGVGFNYINIGDRPLAGSESGKDAWAITASLTLPIWVNSGRSAVASGHIKEGELSSEKLVVEAYLKRLFIESKSELDDAMHRQALYQETLIPQMKQITMVQESEYETGVTTFIDLFDSYEQLLKLELALAKAEQERFSAEAILNWLTMPVTEGRSHETN